MAFIGNQDFTPKMLACVSDNSCADPSRFFYFVVDTIIPSEKIEKYEVSFVICEIQGGVQSITPGFVKQKLIENLKSHLDEGGQIYVADLGEFRTYSENFKGYDVKYIGNNYSLIENPGHSIVICAHKINLVSPVPVFA